MPGESVKNLERYAASRTGFGVVQDPLDQVTWACGDSDGACGIVEDDPAAEVYLLKHSLHDWPDTGCSRIASVIRRAAIPTSRLFVCGFVVPGPEQPHFAKLFDIPMMTAFHGRERTAAESASLLAQTGWRAGRLLTGGVARHRLRALPRHLGATAATLVQYNFVFQR